MYTKKDIKKASNLNSAMILFFLGSVTLISFAYEPLTRLFVNETSPYYDSVYTLIAYTLQYIIGLGGALLIFYSTKTGKEVKKERPLLAKPKMPASWIFRHIIICFFLTYSVVYASSFLFAILENLTGIKLNSPDFTAKDNVISRIANVAGLMFFAPIFEETFFRGSVLRSNLRFGKWSMVIVSGIFFGLWHMNLSQMLYASAMGIYAGFVYAKTRSLIPTLIIHFTFNTIGTIQSIFAGSVDLENVSFGSSAIQDYIRLIPLELLGLLIIMLILTGLILFIIELVNHPESYKLDDETEKTDGYSTEDEINAVQPENKMSGAKLFAVYLSAPVTLTTLILLFSLTILTSLVL